MKPLRETRGVVLGQTAEGENVTVARGITASITWKTERDNDKEIEIKTLTPIRMLSKVF